MATNPLFQNGFYFFSGMYDDKIIVDLYKQIQRESFSQSKNIQDFTIGRKLSLDSEDLCNLNSNGLLYHKTLNEFSVNTELNKKLGIPLDSVSLIFDNFNIPYFNKKRFINKYGMGMSLIPLTDLYSESGIFDKYVKVTIGPYRITKANLVILDSGKIALVIISSNTLGIPSESFANLSATLGDANVYLKLEAHSTIYSGTITSAANITDSTDSGYKVITVNKSTQISNYEFNSENHSNAWDISLTYNSSIYGQRILACTGATQVSSTDETISFKVAASFVNHITSNQSSMNFLIEKCPYLQSTYSYKYDATLLPILSLAYSNNAIGISNINVFKYDIEKAWKKELIQVPKNTVRYFPNIIDLTDVIGTNDVLIEVVEYPESLTNQTLWNPIKKVISSLASENKYANAVLNEYFYSENPENHNPLLSFNPSISSITADDYTNSEYFGNFRGYVLDKICKAINLDGSLYTKYLKLMEDLNKTSYTFSGTPKEMGFGGSTRGGEFVGSNPVVTSTSFISQNPDDVLQFTEPHSFIKYYSENKSVPCNVYINGQYIEPTEKRFYRGFNYIFFPVSKMNSFMDATNFPTEDQLKACKPITIETYPNAYESKLTATTDNINISDISDGIKLFQKEKDFYATLSDITLVNSDTGQFIDLFSNFDISIDVDINEIKSVDMTDVISTYRGDGIQYLLTVLNELYKTMDSAEIIVSNVTTETISLNEFVDSISSLPEFDGKTSREIIELFSHKKLNFKNVKFTPTNMSLNGARIQVYLNNYKEVNVISGADIMENGGMYLAIFYGSNTDINKNRYQLYINGKYYPAQIEFESDYYGSAVGAFFPPTFTYNQTDVISLVHSPIEKTSISWLPYRKVSESDDTYEVQLYHMSDSVNTNGTSQNTIWQPKSSLSSGIFVIHDIEYDSLNNEHFPTPPISPYLFNDDSVSLFSSDGYRLYPESKYSDIRSMRYYDATSLLNTQMETSMLDKHLGSSIKNVGLAKTIDYTILPPTDNILREICNTNINTI